MPQPEGKYKTQLTSRIYKRFGEDCCLVVRLDAGLRQGVPDMAIIFEGGFWAFLEAKTSAVAPHRPNQPYYVELLDRMCFAAFIYPENEEAVLHGLEQEYWNHRATRLS